MKMANVVSVRDIVEDNHPELNRSSRRAEIEALLRRYPKTSEAETAEIVHFLATGPHLDVGLVAGNDAFSEKVAEIRNHNPSRFRLKLGEAIVFALAIGGPALLLMAKYLLA